MQRFQSNSLLDQPQDSFSVLHGHQNFSLWPSNQQLSLRRQELHSIFSDPQANIMIFSSLCISGARDFLTFLLVQLCL